MSGEGTCSRCGKATLYGRHLHNEECEPCPECLSLGLASYPCIHDLMREQEEELDVWLGGLPAR